MMEPALESPGLTTPDSSLESQPLAADVRLLGAIIVLAKHKRLMLRILAVGTLLGLALALFLPKKFEATARIMPPQQNQSMAASMLGPLGPLAAALTGRDIGLRNASDLYVAMLRSRTVADALISRFSLMQVYKKKNLEDTRKRLDAVTEITAGRESVITITVRDRDPQRATEMANAYIEQLQKLTKTLAVTEAGRRRIFFEQEVQKANVELAAAELAMKHVQETTGVIQLDSQSKAMIEGLITVRAQVMAKEAQIQSMRTFATPENPDLVRAERELQAMKATYATLERGGGGNSMADVPLEKVPTAALEYLRRLRELKYRESLLEVLTKQYESARIDEAKDAALIQVLDPAVRPGVEMRRWPFRIMVGLLVLLFSFLLASSLVFLLEYMAQVKNNPEYSSRLQLLNFWLHNAPKSTTLTR